MFEEFQGTVAMHMTHGGKRGVFIGPMFGSNLRAIVWSRDCLLYTSDAADE